MSRADDARKAATPWRGRSLKRKPSNEQLQQKALKRMSLFQRTTGIALEDFEDDQRAQRERVRKRWGITEAA